MRIPSLVARAGPGHADLVDLYAHTDPNHWVEGGPGVYSTGHEIAMTLRPHESLQLQWDNVGKYHDDTTWDAPPPPVYANGQIVSSLDLTDPGYTQWIVSQHGVRSFVDDGQTPRLSPVQAGVAGELSFCVDSPYAIVGSTLSADLHRRSVADTIEVYAAGWADRIDVLSDAMTGPEKGYRIPGFFASEGNVSTFADDGSWPPVHTTLGLQPAHLMYRMRPTHEPGGRVIVGGMFYRFSDADLVGLSISTDGSNWQSIWTAEPGQTGYFRHVSDITETVTAFDDFYVRYDFEALSLGRSYWNATAGLATLEMAGVEPLSDALTWTTTGRADVGDFTATVDLSSVVASNQAAATYHYRIRFVTLSTISPFDAGINGFALTSTVQVAPRSLPALSLGANEVRYSDQSTLPAAVKITHSWAEYQLPRVPLPPAAPVLPPDGGAVPVGHPFVLRWQPSPDPDGARVFQYHVEICSDPECRWPLSSIFDANLAPVAGSDDTSWLVPYFDWFNRGQTYYWRVRVESSRTAQWSAYSPIWSFVVTDSVHMVRRKLSRE